MLLSNLFPFKLSSVMEFPLRFELEKSHRDDFALAPALSNDYQKIPGEVHMFSRGIVFRFPVKTFSKSKCFLTCLTYLLLFM